MDEKSVAKELIEVNDKTKAMLRRFMQSDFCDNDLMEPLQYAFELLDDITEALESEGVVSPSAMLAVQMYATYFNVLPPLQAAILSLSERAALISLGKNPDNFNHG